MHMVNMPANIVCSIFDLFVTCPITYLLIRPHFTIKAEIHRPFSEAYVYVCVFGATSGISKTGVIITIFLRIIYMLKKKLP